LRVMRPLRPDTGVHWSPWTYMLRVGRAREPGQDGEGDDPTFRR